MPSTVTPDSPSRLPDDAEAARIILELAGATGAGKTIDPTDAARAILPGESAWQRALPMVRRVAVRLAIEGRLVIYRKGKPVDPQDFRGVYRLGLPHDE